MEGNPKTIAIVGVGLIGGSVAAAAKKRLPETTVIGIDRDESDVLGARELGLLDDSGCRIQLVENADVIVVCTPVDRIANDVTAVAEHAKQDAIITDVGSVKGTIVSALEDLAEAGGFVGSHPMAGSEKSGYRNADGDLFENINCILCPTDETPENATDTIARFWEQLGANVARMSAEDHDKIVAAISHLPHAVAAALARTPDSGSLPFAATGFADSTRIANGDPELWAAIFDSNRVAILNSIDQFEAELVALRKAIATGQQPIGDYLSKARGPRNSQ